MWLFLRLGRVVHVLGQNTFLSRDGLIWNSHNCRLLGAGSVPGDMLICEKECRLLPGRWLRAGLWSPGSGWSRT